MASITISGGGLSLDPTTAEYIRKYPVIRDRVYALDRLASSSRVAANALFELRQDNRTDYAAGARRLVDFESKVGTPAQQPSRVIEAQRDEVEKLKADGADLTAKLSEKQRVAYIDAAALRSATSLLARLAATDSPPRIVIPALAGKGDRAARLDEVRPTISEKSGTLTAVKKAAIPEDEAVRLGTRAIDELIAAQALRFDFADARGPMPYVGFASLDDDEARKAPNLLGALLALNRDEAVEQLKAQAHRHYSTKVEMALDAQTKRDRIASLEAELLALERIDVELVLALRAEGRDVCFRPNTDARALLGVEGVSALKPDSNLMEVGDF